jgi:hypothetical protein
MVCLDTSWTLLAFQRTVKAPLAMLWTPAADSDLAAAVHGKLPFASDQRPTVGAGLRHSTANYLV